VRVLLATPNTTCREQGLHLARYVRAYRRGLLSQKDLAAICEALAQVSAGHVVSGVSATLR
jgi:hypothetical protein